MLRKILLIFFVSLLFTILFIYIRLPLGSGKQRNNENSCSKEEEDDEIDPDLIAVTECVQAKIKNISEKEDKYEHYNFDASEFEHLHLQPFVKFVDVIDEEDINHLMVLGKCVKEILPGHYDDRKFLTHDDKYHGGNNVTFIGGFIHEIFPELEKHIKTIAGIAAEKANFRPHPEHLGIHCVEILEYEEGGELRLHTDLDSIFTMAIMLTDSTEYEGGDFYIESTYGEPKTFEFTVPKYGGYLFDSQADHGLTKMTRGKREVLVIELWPFEDIAYDQLRPGTEDQTPVLPLFMEINPDGSSNYEVDDE